MARIVPALSTRGACPQGRGAAQQEEAEGWTAGDQGTNKAAVEGPAERGGETEEEEEDKDDESRKGDNDKKSSSGGEESN